MSDIDLEHIIEVSMIRNKIKDNPLLLTFFNEMIMICNKKKINVVLDIDKLNEYDEDINTTSDSDEETWS